MNETTFKFKRHDHIGAAAAEDDEFLEACFVDTGDLDLLRYPEDNRIIVLGRTGSGKSALLAELARREEHTILVHPESLALSYISNSTILRYFADLGVNLDPFFKLLWRHVLTVEILTRHLEHSGDAEKTNFMDRLRSRFGGRTREDFAAQDGIRYLQTWGNGDFWKPTETRVKELTRRFERDLEKAAEAKIEVPEFSIGGSLSRHSSLSQEEREELVNRGQEIVSQAQVQDLSKITDLLSLVLVDKQKQYFVTIDGLDEDWVEERLRYKLIMALIATAREFIKIKHAKIVMALRRDLVERVFRLTRDSGFQEEKYQSLYLPLEWSKQELLAILDKRVCYLVGRRYTKASVTHKDLLPVSVQKQKIGDYLTARAQRPRDIIAFFNTCIDASEGRPKINAQIVRKAEGEYSRSRMRALANEWSADYPELLDCARLLRARPASFKIKQIDSEDVNEVMLALATNAHGNRGALVELAFKVVDLLMSAEEAKAVLVRIFYRIGLVGLKLAPHESVSWVDERGRSISAAEIGPETSVVVHSAFHRALGVRP